MLDDGVHAPGISTVNRIDILSSFLRHCSATQSNKYSFNLGVEGNTKRSTKSEDSVGSFNARPLDSARSQIDVTQESWSIGVLDITLTLSWN